MLPAPKSTSIDAFVPFFSMQVSPVHPLIVTDLMVGGLPERTRNVTVCT